MKRALIAMLALLVVATVADAGRKDDFEFAQGLMERKFYDLAKEQFEKIVNDSGRSGEEQAAGELGLALLLKAQAADARSDSKKTPEEVLEIFGAAEGRFDKFLGNYPSHSKRDLAKFEVGSLLHSKGLYLRDQIDKNPDQAAEFRAKAEEAFDAAIDLFKEAAEILEEKAEEDESFSWPSKRVRFYELAANYDKGMVYPEDSAERQGILTKTSGMCENFIWDNEENLFGGYAYMYWGLVMRGLDEPDAAMEYFTTCADMPLPNIEQDGLRSYNVWSNLFMQAYYKLGEYANTLGEKDGTDYRDTAVKQIEQMMERIPDCWEKQFGHLTLLEYARALSGLGRFADARDIVSKVSQKGDEIGKREPWGEGTAYLANRLLNEIMADARIGGVALKTAPDVLFKAASGKKAAQQWAEAVFSFQGVVSACETPEEIKEYAMPAWMAIGECYYRSEKFFEAYFTYDRAEREFDGTEIAGDAAYYRYRAITARHGETKDPRDEALKKKARGDFATKYKDHPRSIDLQYFEGADLIGDGDALRSANKELEAKATYNEALSRLGNTKDTSILYAKAQSRIGEVLYKLDKPADALKKFDAVLKYIANKKNVTTDPNRRANRLQARAICTYFASRCHKDMENWDEVVKALADYETIFSDESVRNFHAAVKFERLRAMLRLERLAEAESETVKLAEEWPDAPQVPLAYSMLSSAYARAAKAAKEANDTDSWKAQLPNAAKYFEAYLAARANKEVSWQEAQLLGFWYFDLDDLAGAEPWLDKALEGLGKAIDALREGAELEKLKKQADGLLQRLAGILLQQKKYGEAKAKLEALLIPDPGARERVLELLRQQEHSQASLKELMDKIRAIPSLMENLASTYRYVGAAEDLFRALTLLKVLERADPKNKYTEIGWRRKLLMCEIYLQYGRDFRDQNALKNVIKLVNDWETLGVLENCPFKEQFFKLRAEASK